MKRLLNIQDGIIQILNYYSNLELSMYRNQILHYFVSESLFTIAVLSQYYFDI